MLEGALLRSADGAGVDAVIAADPVSDIWNPNAIRASLGTIFSTPVATCTSSEALAAMVDTFTGAVSDRLTRLGLDIGRQEKMGCINATMLTDNVGMLALCKKLGFKLEKGDDVKFVNAVIEL